MMSMSPRLGLKGLLHRSSGGVTACEFVRPDSKLDRNRHKATATIILRMIGRSLARAAATLGRDRVTTALGLRNAGQICHGVADSSHSPGN